MSNRENKLKILFLDIDGVLNSVRSAIALNGYPCRERCHEKFDKVALALIRQACKKTGAKICLSSTWRIGIKNILKFGKELDLPIIAKTPQLFMSRRRGREIQEWLEDNQKVVCKYAIVDDDSDMLKEQLPFFVQTDNYEGLLYRDYVKLLALLE